MAPPNTAPIGDSENKTFFECCKKKESRISVCVQCGKVYHKSCVLRDHANRVEIIDETRLICCQQPEPGKQPATYQDIITEKSNQIDLLRQLVKEMESKNKLLEENKLLLEEKLENALKKTASGAKKEVNKSDLGIEMTEATNAATSQHSILAKNITSNGSEDITLAATVAATNTHNMVATPNPNKEEDDSDFKTVASRKQMRRQRQTNAADENCSSDKKSKQ